MGTLQRQSAVLTGAHYRDPENRVNTLLHFDDESPRKAAGCTLYLRPFVRDVFSEQNTGKFITASLA